ncbi:hypothetical protein ABLT88_05505 [Acinetobacter radioresistens]|uniref:hypothetical protein n=2 Tax=Acinetobacter radioresistens TaxID=40216 RepID=UPI0032B4B6D8
MIDTKMSLDTRLILKVFRIGQYFFKRKKSFIYLFIYLFIKLFYTLIQIIYGFSLPFSAKIGRNVCFRHGFYGIFISSHAEIGNNVIIMHQVTIGSNYSSLNEICAPVLKDNIFVGPGAKIIGNVVVESNTKIGANALLVNQSLEPGIYVSSRATKL